MSSASEERWRTSRGQQKSSDQNQNPNHSRQFNQQRGTFSREGGGSGQPQHDLVSGNQATRTMSGNVWVNNDRGSREAPRPAQEHHVPVNGFNAQEARNTLKNGFSSENKKATSYRNSGQAQVVKSGSPWASKPNTMGNSKDFFLELRKQLSTFQQHGSERAGG